MLIRDSIGAVGETPRCKRLLAAADGEKASKGRNSTLGTRLATAETA